MITVDVNQLTAAIRETTAFELPGMTEGTRYLYDAVYSRMAQDEPVRLSGLDFGAFESGDITSLTELYTEVFEKNERAAYEIISELRGITPAHSRVSFI